MPTLAEKVGQLFVVGFEGFDPPAHILDWLAEGRIGGVILFSRNVDNPRQLANLTEQCHDAAKQPILIGIDQEGGAVARLRDDFTESPGAMALSAAKDGEQHTERVSRVLADEMHALGINWTYAPVLDITYNIDNPTVGVRSAGADKMRVSQIASAAVRGFQAGGVAACGKHFPGLGNTAIDTHLALPTLDAPLEQLLENDLTPYRAVIETGIASIMTTHTIFSALDDTYPATLSPVIVRQLLRDTLQFDQVVVTDCLEMKAIADHYGEGEAAVLAVLAGIDILLISHTRSHQEAAYDAVLAAAESGRISEDVLDAAIARIQAMKTRYAIQHTPHINTIQAPEHIETVNAAARAGVVLVKPHEALPLPADKSIGLIEFASLMDSEVMERGEHTGFGRRLLAKAPHINTVALKSVNTSDDHIKQAHELAQNSDILIIATRNAHLIANQRQLAQQFIGAATGQVLLLCLRNPYDMAALSGAHGIVCTCGDSTPSLQAAVDALLGDYTPSGTLPIQIETLA